MARVPFLFSRASLTSLAACAVVFAGPTAIAQDSENDAVETEVEAKAEAPEELTKGEKRLAKLIEGRVAGKPLNCIRTLPTAPVTVIEDTAYVYGRGKTIYVQRTKNPDRIDRDEIMVARRFNGTQLCRQDVVTTIDRVSGIFTGAVFFEDFVPYTRVKKDDDEKQAT